MIIAVILWCFKKGWPSAQGSHLVGFGRVYVGSLTLQVKRLFPSFEPMTSRLQGSNLTVVLGHSLSP